MNRTNEDFFSPIRLNASTVDSSDISEGSLSELLGGKLVRFSLPDSPKNDGVFENTNSRQANKSKDKPAIAQNVEPISVSSTKDLLNSSKLPADKLQHVKKRESKSNSKKEDSESYQLKKDSLPKESNPKRKSSNSKNIHLSKTSRPTSLLPSKEELTKIKAPKEVKKRQKNSHAAKGIDCLDDVDASDNKILSEKKEKNSKNLKSEDSFVKSSESNNTISVHESTSRSLSDSSKQEQLGLISNPVKSQYEVSVEKMIQECISIETAKIRQSMYLQQMNFYRQMHKIKLEMEQQHLATNQQLFGIVKELTKMNDTLRTILTDKNQ